MWTEDGDLLCKKMKSYKNKRGVPADMTCLSALKEGINTPLVWRTVTNFNVYFTKG